MNVACCFFCVLVFCTHKVKELNKLALLGQNLQIEHKPIRCHFWGGNSGPTEILWDTTQLHQRDDAKSGMYLKNCLIMLRIESAVPIQSIEN